MKKIINKLSFIGLLFTTLTNAQSDASLLWKIEGNGLEQPSYIYGTIHMICQDDYIMTPIIQNSLESVEAYYAEIDFSNPTELLQLQAAIVAEEPLSERFDQETYQELTKLLKSMDIEIDEVENLSNTALISTIGTKTFPCKDLKAYELEFLQMAIASGKQTGGLETVSQQLELLNKSITPENLIEMLQEVSINGTDETQKLVKHYKEHNIDIFVELMKENSYMDAEIYDELLVQRNHRWMELIPEIMDRHSTFFAVGAGHLGGESGILQLLKDRGFEVNAVNIH